jgi:hypothetical protein
LHIKEEVREDSYMQASRAAGSILLSTSDIYMYAAADVFRDL